MCGSLSSFSLVCGVGLREYFFGILAAGTVHRDRLRLARHGNEHYVAFLVQGQQWYCLNDAVVSEVAPGDLPSEACLVFLKKAVRLRAKSTRSCPGRPSSAANARLPVALARAATQHSPSCSPASDRQDNWPPAAEDRSHAAANLGKFASSVGRKRAIRNGEPREPSETSVCGPAGSRRGPADSRSRRGPAKR